MSTTDTAQALETLRRLQSQQEISIIKLSDTIIDPAEQASRQRTSDASNGPLDGPSPASLEADLAHYTELFAKLRFSYVEQVTKEKFIRAIVGDPPLIVTVQENLDLERENALIKAELKALKQEVAGMVAELERRGRQLSRRYESVKLDTARLQDVPAKTEELMARIAELRGLQRNAGADADPNLNLPLAKTLGLVAQRKTEQQELARELDALRSKAPRKRKEAERLRAELGPLEAKLHTSSTAAREARRRKEAALGGVADDLEQRARWWRASEEVLKQVLELKS